MGRFSTRQVAFAALALSLAVGISAHEHHEEDIPEGEAISPDPIVCGSDQAERRYLD